MRQVCQVVAVVACGVLLSGCGGTPKASPAPSESPSAVESPPKSDPAANPPQLPSAATAATKRGAEAFVRHYVSVLNFAGSTGRTRELSALATPACVRCMALVDGISDIYSDGGIIDGGGWTVTETRPYGYEQSRFFVDAVIDSAPQRIQRSDGEIEQFDGAQARLRAFVLQRTAAGWKVAELDPTA